VSEQTWREVSGKWEAAAAELRAELVTIQPAMKRSEFLQAVRAPFELAETARTKFVTQSAFEKGRLLKTCCSNLIVTDGSVAISMKSPFDVLMKIAGSPDWRPQRDSNPCWRNYLLPAFSLVS
jgi:hypothetical protein